MLEFEWDENKNQSNIKKHGISFEEASSVFYIISDEAHSENEERIWFLKRKQKSLHKVIEETNYYQGKLVFNSDGSIKTTKEDNQKYHGYGTKSIAYVVKKYHGTMYYDTKDGIFKLRIAI